MEEFSKRRTLSIIKVQGEYGTYLLLVFGVFFSFWAYFKVFSRILSDEVFDIGFLLFGAIVFFGGWYISKFRFSYDGKLFFNEKGIFSAQSTTEVNFPWENIELLVSCYRGDAYWQGFFGNNPFTKGKWRYYKPS